MYAPTAERTKKHTNEIEKLYKDLEKTYQDLKKQATSVTFIAGDFNSKVGKKEDEES